MYSDSSRNPWGNSVEMGLYCKGLGHWRGIAWDPGRVGGQCLHVCYDCLRVIALFHEVMLVVHDWAYLPAWTVTGIGYFQTNTCEVGCLGTIYATCDVYRFFGSDEWQIKGREAAVTTGGDDVIRSLLCTGVRVTSVGVVSPGMLLILGIGLRDCAGGSIVGCDWLDQLSGWEWPTRRPMGACSTGVFFPGGVRIVYIRSVFPGALHLMLRQ